MKAVYHIEKPKDPCAEDLATISDLYRLSIPQSFIAQITPSFFSKLIHYGLSHSFCHLLLLRKAQTHTIDGFIVFTGSENWMKKIVYRHPITFAFEGIKNIFNTSVYAYLTRSMLLRLFGKKKSNTPHPMRRVNHSHTELFAIAISEPLRGKGWGKKLICAFEDDLKSTGNPDYIVMTLDSNKTSNFLYRRIGAKLIATHDNPSGLVNVYIKTLGNKQ